MKKFSRTFKISIFLLLAILSWFAFAPFLAKFLIIEKPLEKADAILVLGGSSTYIERTQKAAELYENGVAEKVLLTDDGGRGGWNKTEKTNLKFVEMARRNLVLQGVPAENIEVLEPTVAATIDEARLLAETARARNLKKILLVTSAYHTRRALWIFEKVAAKEEIELGIESPETGIETPPPQMWWKNRRGWQTVGGEYVKFVYYWWFY